MTISNIHNRTPKSGILFTEICMKRVLFAREFLSDRLAEYSKHNKIAIRKLAAILRKFNFYEMFFICSLK